MNQTLRSRLATVSHGKTRRWDKHLYSVISQYNRMPHSETGRPPAEFFVQKSTINVPAEPYWRAPKNFKPYQVGDLVLRKTPYQPAGETDKLGPRFQGPLRVVEADPSGVTYRAQWLSGTQKIIQLHVSQMKRFNGDIYEQELDSPARTRRSKPNDRLEAPDMATPKETPFIPCDVFDIPWQNFRDIPLINVPNNAPIEPVLEAAEPDEPAE